MVYNLQTDKISNKNSQTTVQQSFWIGPIVRLATRAAQAGRPVFQRFLARYVCKKEMSCVIKCQSKKPEEQSTCMRDCQKEIAFVRCFFRSKDDARS